MNRNSGLAHGRALARWITIFIDSADHSSVVQPRCYELLLPCQRQSPCLFLHTPWWSHRIYRTTLKNLLLSLFWNIVTRSIGRSSRFLAAIHIKWVRKSERQWAQASTGCHLFPFGKNIAIEPLLLIIVLLILIQSADPGRKVEQQTHVLLTTETAKKKPRNWPMKALI